MASIVSKHGIVFAVFQSVQGGEPRRPAQNFRFARPGGKGVPNHCLLSFNDQASGSRAIQPPPFCRYWRKSVGNVLSNTRIKEEKLLLKHAGAGSGLMK